MKKVLFIVSVAALFTSCCTQKATSQEIVFKNFTDTVSYMIGTDIAKSFQTNKIEINNDMLFAGIRDIMGGKTSQFTQEQFQNVMGRFQKDMQQKQQIESAKQVLINKEKGKAYMEENKKKEGVMQTASGLQYKILRDATGPKPLATNTVKVNYEGKLLDGTIFDSSYERGKPIEFGLGQVIKGWTEGLQLMSVGSMYELVIPSDLAYGDGGNQGIPPGATLIFKVELLDFK